jgi:vitamin B12 transporter
VFGASEFVTDGSRAKAEYLGRYSVSDALGLQFGADWTRESSDTNFSDEETNTTVGVFAQADWSPIEPLTLNGALRHDDHSEFGGYTTGRLTAAYLLPTDTVLRAALGTGFRAPSNFELFDPFSGNPDFEPETSRSADIGVEQRLAGGRGRIAATLFWLQIDDLIEFDNATSVFVQTDGTAESSGLELAGGWDLTDRLTLSGAYTYTDAKLPDGSPRLRIPRHALDLALDGSATNRIDVGLAATYAADLPDEPFAESEAFAEDYFVMSARAGYVLTEAADLYVRAENIFDKEYQTAEGFSTADRSVYFGVSGRF